jgi:hypothetical protein
MDRRWIGRLMAGGAVGILAALGIDTAPARADDEVDQITISGGTLAEPLVVLASEQPTLCADLHAEVRWLVNRRADAPEPDPETLGPQYVMVVHVEGEERHRFELYPLAAGGPRVFRPAEQPGDRSVRNAWFYARLTLPETLAAAGAPLDGNPMPPGGGVGGGEPAVEETSSPEAGPLAFVDEWREGVLLTVAMTVALLVGLGGIAYLIRNKV